MTTKEKARAYYEGDPDLYATSGWLDHDAIEGIVIDAFTAGYMEANERIKELESFVGRATKLIEAEKAFREYLESKEPTWHKTSEELPKDTGEVLVCWETAAHQRKYTEIAGFYRNADDWWFEDEDGQRITYKAKWWMYIPELPKED